MLTLMGKFDHDKGSAAEGGYASGLYPDFFTPDGRLDIPFLTDGLKNFRQGRVEHSADAELRFKLFREFELVDDFGIRDCLDPSSFIAFAHSRAETVAARDLRKSLRVLRDDGRWQDRQPQLFVRWQRQRARQLR